MHKIVVYHAIKKPEMYPPADADVSPLRFEEHLRRLARGARVVTLRDTLVVPKKYNRIAITFDGGCRNNLTAALPLLEKYDLPMTLFMPAGFIGREDYLTSDDLKSLAAHRLVTIGSHAVSRQPLTRLSKQDARFELLESKKILEETTGKTVDLLAYPYGDRNRAIERLSEECGYAAAWTIWKGDNAAFSRWRIPLGSRDNFLRFKAKISMWYFPAKMFVKPPISDARKEDEREKFIFGLE